MACIYYPIPTAGNWERLYDMYTYTYNYVHAKEGGGDRDIMYNCIE